MKKIPLLIKTCMHICLYLLAIFFIFLLCSGIADSFKGYSTKDLSGTYVHDERTLTFGIDRVSVESASTYREYSYFVEEGIVYFSDEAYLIYADGLLEKGGNAYYVKV